MAEQTAKAGLLEAAEIIIAWREARRDRGVYSHDEVETLDAMTLDWHINRLEVAVAKVKGER